VHDSVATALTLASPVRRYADYASSDQRASMLLEFYGPKYALFKGKGKVKSLDDILEAQPDKKGKILEHIKTTLTPLLEKGLCAHHIVHRALYNYLRFIPPGGNEFSEMLEAIKELLVEM
jgi:pumilio family protein 6